MYSSLCYTVGPYWLSVLFIVVWEAETPILWPLDEKNRPIRKDPDAGKYWRQEEKGMTENKMVG